MSIHPIKESIFHSHSVPVPDLVARVVKSKSQKLMPEIDKSKNLIGTIGEIHKTEDRVIYENSPGTCHSCPYP